MRAFKFSISPAILIAFFIIAFDVLIRLALIFNNWPETNSDEATVGLMALHILHGRDFPVYLYGQGSLGALEAYIGAALFSVFGPSTLVLRIGVLLLYIVFLVCIYLLARLLYSEGVALITLVLLGLGTPEILFRAIPAFAGHAETPLFGTLIMLVSAKIGMASRVAYAEISSRQRWRLAWLYALWGFIAALAYWNDTLASSFILAGAIYLLLCCRATLRRATLFAGLAGLLIGILPLVLNDLAEPLAQKSISSVAFLVNTGGPIPYDSLFARLAAAFLVTLPVSTGATGICTFQNWRTDPWPITPHSSPSILQCTTAHGIWATVIVALWVVAVAMEIRNPSSQGGGKPRPYPVRLRHPIRSRIGAWLRRGATTSTLGIEHASDSPLAESPAEAKVRALHGARLMLLGSAALTWLVFALSAQSIANPWGNNRYLIGLAVAIPALIWPLWRGLKSIAGHPLRPSPALLRVLLSAAIILCFAGTLVIGTIDTFNAIRPTQAATLSENVLASGLLDMRLKHIYSDYWTCDLVTFLTKEQVICSVLDGQLGPGVNRYTPYVGIVASDPDASYVFPAGSAQAQVFAKRIEQTNKHYKITRFDNYIVYQPVSA